MQDIGRSVERDPDARVSNGEFSDVWPGEYRPGGSGEQEASHGRLVPHNRHLIDKSC